MFETEVLAEPRGDVVGADLVQSVLGIADAAERRRAVPHPEHGAARGVTTPGSVRLQDRPIDVEPSERWIGECGREGRHEHDEIVDGRSSRGERRRGLVDPSVQLETSTIERRQCQVLAEVRDAAHVQRLVGDADAEHQSSGQWTGHFRGEDRHTAH
jgi:hypothetical protein